MESGKPYLVLIKVLFTRQAFSIHHISETVELYPKVGLNSSINFVLLLTDVTRVSSIRRVALTAVIIL